MTKLNVKTLNCRKLFTVDENTSPCNSKPDLYIGIAENGDLICIAEWLVTISAAWGTRVEYYQISKQEYRQLLETAKKNGNLQKAVDAGKITLAYAEQLGR